MYRHEWRTTADENMEDNNGECDDEFTVKSLRLLRERHLDWTAKQGRILTANGRANEYYCSERGFPFREDELPHYYLMQGGDTTFQQRLISSSSQQQQQQQQSHINNNNNNIICGAWSRAFFVGGWEHSSDQDETVYNLQTNTLFIDLRIPTTTRNRLLPSLTTTTTTTTTTTSCSLADYTVEQLRVYARQHVFCGFSVVSTECNNKNDKRRPVCVRHHSLDWNFVGIPRSRPNKWWIETKKKKKDDVDDDDDNDDNNIKTWKEWAYATDDHGQHYYCEQWERLLSPSPAASAAGDHGESFEPILALRKQQLHDDSDEDDGMLLVVGTHFNYIRGRAVVASGSCNSNKYPNATSLVTLVDDALEAGDVATALLWLGRIEAGHGRTDTWIIDCAIQPWKENTRLFQEEELVVKGGDDDDLETCHVVWKGEEWNVFETTFQNVQQLKDLFQIGRVAKPSSSCL